MKFNYICIWVGKNTEGEKLHIQAINYLWLLEEAILITANWLSVRIGASEREGKDVIFHVSLPFIFYPSALLHPLRLLIYWWYPWKKIDFKRCWLVGFQIFHGQKWRVYLQKQMLISLNQVFFLFCTPTFFHTKFVPFSRFDFNFLKIHLHQHEKKEQTNKHSINLFPIRNQCIYSVFVLTFLPIIVKNKNGILTFYLFVFFRFFYFLFPTDNVKTIISIHIYYFSLPPFLISHKQ